jgi:FtsP/CotA-like multicopper oxidase with cupredoxin domain
VHWHGIELDSYSDGVAGWSGSGAQLEPMIAPNDSFEVRFTPPRSGTFMYHSHMRELFQQTGGLSGALIVRDRGTAREVDDHIFMLKGSLALTPDVPLDVNGKTNPDTLVLHIGRAARLRFMSLAVFNPNATVSLTARPDSSFANVRDTMLVRWKPLAKDGADLPSVERAVRAARQIVSIGETFDFEYTPDRRGNLRLEVRGWGDNGTLLVRIPVRVE